MRKLSAVAFLLLTTAGCAAVQHATSHGSNPYDKAPFYSRYLNLANPQDQRILHDLDLLKANPQAASVHNDLGAALVQKGFPYDAKTEFDRALDIDRHFYPAWYNLGLLNASLGNEATALHAFRRTVHYRPGHAASLFQMALIEEKNGDTNDAIEHYAKAFAINRQLLDERVNPRILDSRIIDRVLLRLYPKTHASSSFAFQGAPQGYADPVKPEGGWPQSSPADIVTPTAPTVTPAAPAPTAPPPPPVPVGATATAPAEAVAVSRDTSPGREKDPLPPPNPNAWAEYQAKQKAKRP